MVEHCLSTLADVHPGTCVLKPIFNISLRACNAREFANKHKLDQLCPFAGFTARHPGSPAQPKPLGRRMYAHFAEVYTNAPWQCLNFLPEPHGQGALRPTFPQVEGSFGSISSALA